MSIEQPLSPVLAFLAALAFPAAAIGADTRPLANPAVNAAPADATGKPPLIVHNPDGTMTVQKEPARGKTEDTGQKGLVIPPQVVAPVLRVPANAQQH